MFPRPVHTSLKKFENATITGPLYLCLSKSGLANYRIIRMSSFSKIKAPFPKCFPSTLKRKEGVFWFPRFDKCFRKAPFPKCFTSTLKRKGGALKFLRFDKCFRKAQFSWRISMDEIEIGRKKAMFSNFSGIVWRGPYTYEPAKNSL